MLLNVDTNIRPDYDAVIQKIASYVLHYDVRSEKALQTARYCLMDALGCALLALRFPECTKHLGPTVAGSFIPHGTRVPGTQLCVDPIKGAFDIGCLIRWLDYNDTWLAAEWGHPSDNLGAILALSDHLSQQRMAQRLDPFVMQDVLKAMVMAHEIQGVLALKNSFNRVGLDHVILVKLASTALAAKFKGASFEQMCAAISHAFVDGQALRTYRHAPNAGSRKSWAAGDATARGVRLADIACRDEMGIPGVLSAPHWGFLDVLFQSKTFSLPQPFATYVMENVLFKISYPAEFHAQTAVEAAVALHPHIIDKIDQIARIELTTHESAIRIISKSGALANPADRDHCLQYMVAVALLMGNLQAEHYEDSFHEAHPQLDQLREKMVILEDKNYSQDYHEADKRAIGNAIQIFFTDNSATDKVEIPYPIGHSRRREEGIPLLQEKFARNLATRFPSAHVEKILNAFAHADFAEIPVPDFMGLFVI